MGRTRSVFEDSSKADKPNGMGDVVESSANSEAGQGGSPDLLPGLVWDEDANIYQRLIKAQAEAKALKKGNEARIKTKKGGEFAYKYISHDDVAAAAKPILTKNGILFFPTVESLHQDGNRTALKIKAVFINADRPEEKLESIAYGYANDDQDKGPGKAYSYAVKYILAKALLLNTADDIEEHSVEYTPSQIAEKTEADIKGWFKSFSDQIDNTHSYEQLKGLKTDNLAMIKSPAVPDKTKEAILEKLDTKIGLAKEVLLQDEAE